MKKNGFTLWLFSFLYKTRIKEKIETFPSGWVCKIYTPQYRSFIFFVPYWSKIPWKPQLSFEGMEMLDIAKTHIDLWLNTKQESFFTISKVKYIKYP